MKKSKKVAKSVKNDVSKVSSTVAKNVSNIKEKLASKKKNKTQVGFE